MSSFQTDASPIEKRQGDARPDETLKFEAELFTSVPARTYVSSTGLAAELHELGRKAVSIAQMAVRVPLEGIYSLGGSPYLMSASKSTR